MYTVVYIRDKTQTMHIFEQKGLYLATQKVLNKLKGSERTGETKVIMKRCSCIEYGLVISHTKFIVKDQIDFGVHLHAQRVLLASATHTRFIHVGQSQKCAPMFRFGYHSII